MTKSVQKVNESFNNPKSVLVFAVNVPVVLQYLRLETRESMHLGDLESWTPEAPFRGAYTVTTYTLLLGTTSRFQFFQYIYILTLHDG